MRVSDYCLARLAREGIDTAFLVYGGAMAELADAFLRQSAMRYVCAQHEQAAGFCAEGYSKAKGVPGLVITTSGPGGGNIVTCLQNAYYDSVPLIALTGQVASNLVRPKDSPARQLGFQETNIVEIARSITKYAVMAEGPAHAVYSLETAILEAKSARPGPVLLDIPSDIQKAELPVELENNAYATEPPPRNVAAEAAQFMADLAHAERPGILVGGGAHKARADIGAFAQAHSIPVFRTWNALDVVTDDHLCYGGTIGTYGGPGRNFGVQNCDLLLIIGCRLSGRITGGMPQSFARGAKRYIVNVDSALLDPRWQEVKGDVNVLCDAGEFIRALA
jgi:acetolactate synthase-1/2/3 large subunit